MSVINYLSLDSTVFTYFNVNCEKRAFMLQLDANDLISNVHPLHERVCYGSVMQPLSSLTWCSSITILDNYSIKNEMKASIGDYVRTLNNREDSFS